MISKFSQIYHFCSKSTKRLAALFDWVSSSDLFQFMKMLPLGIFAFKGLDVR